MSNSSSTQTARRRRKGVPALLTVVAGAALAATVAGPAPSASALVASDQAGDPGAAYFADQNWKPTPVLQAKRDGGKVTLSTGSMIVMPDPTADPGPQTVSVDYYLYKRDANGVFRSFKQTKVSAIPLTYQGRNVGQLFAGSGPIATVETGHHDAYQIRVAVSWYVNYQWQSTVHLRPTETSELSCTNVSGCTVFAPGGGAPASLGLV
jgi:hypothetical protein